jgi:hypothetical protein
MTAHIRLVSSEDENRAGLDGQAIGIDEAPLGLPEETGSDKTRPEQSRRDEMLGEAAPPLVAEPEDRAGGRANGRERSKQGALAMLIAFARPRKAKPAVAIAEAGSAEAESEAALGKRGDQGAEARSEADVVVVPAGVATVADGAGVAGGGARPKGGLGRLLGLAGSRKPRRLQRLESPRPRPTPRRLWASGGMRRRGRTRLSLRPPARSRTQTGRKSALLAGSLRRPRPNIGDPLQAREQSRSFS